METIMTKVLPITTLLVLFSGYALQAFSIENPAIEKVLRISTDEKNGIPFYDFPEEPVLPKFIHFTTDGTFLVHNNNGRTVFVFDRNFSKISSYKTLSPLVLATGEWLLSYKPETTNSPFSFEVSEIKTGTRIATWSGLSSTPDLFVLPPFIYGHSTRGDSYIWRVDQKTASVELFTEKQLSTMERKYGATGFIQRNSSQQGPVLFYNGRLLQSFLDAFRLVAGKSPKVTFEDGSTEYILGTLVGETHDGTKYFYDGKSILTILDHDAEILKCYKLNPRPSSSLGVDEQGNVYFFRSSEEGHDLFRIRRTW